MKGKLIMSRIKTFSITILILALLINFVPKKAYADETNVELAHQHPTEVQERIDWNDVDVMNNVLNYLLNEDYYESPEIDQISHCGNFARSIVDSFAENNDNLSPNLVEKINLVKSTVFRNKVDSENSIMTYGITNSNSEYYEISPNNMFRIVYDDVYSDSDAVGVAYALSVVIETLWMDYFQDAGFSLPTTGNSQYFDIFLVWDLGYSGLTYFNPTFIKLNYGPILDEYNNTDYSVIKDFYWGVVVHELMHVVMDDYGIPYSGLFAQFQESVARTAGILVSDYYCNGGGIAGDTNYFLNSQSATYLTVNTYGNSLFQLFLYEEMGESWDYFYTLINQYYPGVTSSPYQMIDNALYEYGTSLTHQYHNFVLCNSNVDRYYYNSPTNRGINNPESWGRSHCQFNYTVNSSHRASGASTLAPLSSNSLRFVANNSTAKILKVTITLSGDFADNSVGISVYYKNSTTGTYNLSVATDLYETNNERIFNFWIGGTDEVILSISNGNLNQNITYSFASELY